MPNRQIALAPALTVFASPGRRALGILCADIVRTTKLLGVQAVSDLKRSYIDISWKWAWFDQIEKTLERISHTATRLSGLRE